MTSRCPEPIAVVGTENWLEVGANLLRHAHLQVEVVRVPPRWFGLSWVLARPFRAARTIHVIWGGYVVVSLAAACLLRKKLVWHWIGTDVVRYRQRGGVAGWLGRVLARRAASLHLADSPELAEELKNLGIRADIVRLLPASIQADPVPLPDTFRVLAYWVEARRRFYGGDIVLELAGQMPEVEFRIVGSDGYGAPQMPNVRYLGRCSAMDEVYADVSVLVRLPEHDSLSAMVLEALARGRYVIYNRDFPGCHRADSRPQVCRALEDIRAKTEPNWEGARFVRENFSLGNEASALRRAYSRVFAGRKRG
jgi:hypothetical protein